MKEDLTGVIITGLILLLLLGLGTILRAGKGAFLISGYNMLSQKEKEKYAYIIGCLIYANTNNRFKK